MIDKYCRNCANHGMFIGGSPCFDCIRSPQNNSVVGNMPRGTKDNWVEDKRSIGENMKADLDKVIISKTSGELSKQFDEYGMKKVREFIDSFMCKDGDDEYLDMEKLRKAINEATKNERSILCK